MVAIVIVSHSLRLAQGIEELALQMSGGVVPLAIAAGIDDPQNPIGTDAIAIMSAIESVWTPEGVLVLMDMGSALLSTEMALELLSEEQRSAIYLLAAPIVEGAMSAVTSAAAGLSAARLSLKWILPYVPNSSNSRLILQTLLHLRYHRSIIPSNGKPFAGRYVIPTVFMRVRQQAS